MKEQVKHLRYEIYKSWQSEIMHLPCLGLIVCTGRVEMRNHVGKDVRSPMASSSILYCSDQQAHSQGCHGQDGCAVACLNTGIMQALKETLIFM